MEFAPIKLQEFAKQNGVTDRAIQRHIKKHEKELQGHVIRKGPNGTWMDEFAQMYIKNLLREHPIVISEASEQITSLEAENKMLLTALNKAKDQIIELKDWKAEKALEIAAAEQNRLLLVASEEEKKILEGFIQDAKAEIAALSDEKTAADKKTREASEAAQKAQDELTVAQERERELKEYLGALDAWSALGVWKRKNKKKHPKPTAPEWLQEG